MHELSVVVKRVKDCVSGLLPKTNEQIKFWQSLPMDPRKDQVRRARIKAVPVRNRFILLAQIVIGTSATPFIGKRILLLKNMKQGRGLLLLAPYSLLMLFAHCSLLFAHCSLLFAHCSLLLAHCYLVLAICSLLFAPCYLLLAICS